MKANQKNIPIPSDQGKAESPVALLDQALIAGNESAVTAALRDLITNQGSWRQGVVHLETFSSAASPNADPEQISQRCRLLFRALQSVASSGIVGSADLQWLTTLLLITARSTATFAKLRKALSSLSFFHDSLSTQTFRLGVLLENQNRLCYRLAAKHGTINDTYHPYAVLDHHVPTRTGGNASLLGAYEELVDAIELVLRFAHYSASPTTRAGALVPRDPFSDPDLERTIVAAGIWHAANDTLGAVKYANWQTHEFSLNHACYAPQDHGEYVRHRVGDIREQAIAAQFHAQALRPLELHQRHQAILEIAQVIEYPSVGETWNGRYPPDLGVLIREEKTFSSLAESWISFRHYEPFARSAKLYKRHGGWTTWLTARAALNILADVFSFCTKAPGTEEDGDDWCRHVVVVKKSDLIAVVCEAGVAKQAADFAVSSMVFDQKRKSLELYDQPLLPLEDDRVLMVPSLLGVASPTRALENAISQWTPTATTTRGFPFEKDILADIEELGFGAVVKGVELSDEEGKPVEYDLIWWWDSHLFLIEAKCVHSVHSFADYASAKSNIEYGMTQLRRRRQVAKARWDQLRSMASQLQLPSDCPSDDAIVCVVLTNVMCFTTWKTKDGIIVTDDVCFRRYFGDSAIVAYRRGVTIGEEHAAQLGHIRSSLPCPLDFVAYLADPPQCRTVLERLEPKMVKSISSETQFEIWRLILEYHPNLSDWLPAVQPGAAPDDASRRG